VCIFGLCCCASDYLSLMQFKIRCGGVAGRDGPDQMHVVCARGPSRDVYTWVCVIPEYLLIQCTPSSST